MSMLDVDEFYEYNLRGKTEDEILAVIQDLKREIIRLEIEIKQPSVLDRMFPSRKTVLSMDRDYLIRAEAALSKIRGKR